MTRPNSVIPVRGLTATACTLLIWLAGCAATAPKAPEPGTPGEALMIARASQQHYFNLMIAAFDNESGDKGGANRVYAPIREIEANYFPVVLRNTLNDSGHWGAVRVTPVPERYAEVMVTGDILESTALGLKLHLHVQDSRGATWLDKVYDYRARPDAYSAADPAHTDAFQPLFNEIANDIYRASTKLTGTDASTVVRAATLRYAVGLAPESFNRYLVEDKDGIINVEGLPADNDRMYARIKKIRAAEYKFDDVMDDEYSNFFARLKKVYPYWQEYSYELLSYNKEINKAGSVSGEARQAGTWAATEDAYDTYKEYKLNEDELRELAASFKSETHKTISKLEGHVIELRGPLQDQYTQWRQLLHKLYATERGIDTVDSKAGN